MMREVKSVSIRRLRAGERDDKIEAFDNTKLSAINTCPTWGIVRYGMHKVVHEQTHRAMALETGALMHEAFAAIRLAQLWDSHPDHCIYHLARLYGRDRSLQLCAALRKATTTEERYRTIAMETLTTSGFIDDPYDRRRTIANIESSVVAYAANYDDTLFPLWVEDEGDPSGGVGVEQSFELLISFYLHDGRCKHVRFTGLIDGVHWHKERGGELLIQDNKTSGRLDDAWSRALDMSHQFTGYVIAGGLLTGKHVHRCVVRGTQIPLPKNISNGLQDVWLVRDGYHRERWLSWLWHTVSLYNNYKGTPLEAPMYTHSCSRYFRPCSMIPMCYASPEDRVQMLEDMTVDEWSPLSDATDG